MAVTKKQPVKQSATVRISEKSRHSLRELAKQSGEPMQAVLDQAVEQYRRQKFLEECCTAYAKIRQDPQEWAAFQAEMAVWDVALMDGLDPNEVWTEEDFVSSEEKAHG